MKDIYDKIVRNPIKKNWFRNWYVIEFGSGYGVTYKYSGWEVAKSWQNLTSIFGPFWSQNQAMSEAKKANDQHYHSMFS